ncbi:DUF2783 domain-containing protein [Minwuia sp.]|uniref:DUF2783 domain-containing protein n=1 Tax=Minwuia sp. TaxID=2493630 RepID=UPI003A90D405
MSLLNTDPNIADPDGFYQQLIETVQHLSPEAAFAYSARLNLILANQIGDNEVLAQALRAARDD